MLSKFLLVGILGAPYFVAGCGGENVTAPPPESASTVAPPESMRDAPDAECSGADCPGKPSPVEAEAPRAPEGNAPSEPVVKEAPSNKPAANARASDVPGANISIGRLEADGLVTKDIECKSEGGGGLGLLGMVLVTAWMSQQKSALDGCAPAGSETRVVWRARGGKVTEIAAKGDAKACVERALRPGKPAFDGHCAATIEHGKK
ncbi:MAG: hypothetical protein IPM54_45305 [Polyangiaceae bacterium]|nr:hypothetical protein [Polyangiaceae bacterium]